MPTQDWLNLVHQNLQSDAGAPMAPTPQFGLTPSANVQAAAPPPAPPAPAPAAPPPPAPAPSPVQSTAVAQDGGIQTGIDALTPQFRMVSPGSAAQEVYTATPNAERLHQEATQTAMQGAETAGGMRQQQANRDADTIGAEYERRQAELGRQAIVNAQHAAVQQRQFDEFKKAQDERTKQIKATVLDKNDSGVQTLGLIFSFLGGGFAGGAQALNSYIDKKIDRDIKLQEFNYKAGLDEVESKKQGFSLALQQTGSEDAAREALRAATEGAWAVKLQQMAASKRGTDEGAKIAEQAAQLMSQSQERQANAFKMSQASGARYQMLLGGQVMPGTFSEADAQKHAAQSAGVRQDIAKHTAEKGIDTVLEMQRDAAKPGKEDPADKGAQEISKQLQQAGVPQARADIEAAIAQTKAHPRGYVERGLRSAGAPNFLFSEKNNNRENAAKNAISALIQQRTGAGMSDTERANYEQMYAKAGSDAERLHVFQSASVRLDELEKNAMAGQSPEAQAKFRAQRDEAKAGGAQPPKSMKPR